AAQEALKGTPLEGSKIYLGGTAATFKDMQDGSNYDLLIAGIASMCLIFIIMLIITRGVVASAVIVGTVLLSLGASFGLSVLIWQHLIGIELHWMVLAMSVIILLAVGADYNLLLVSRFKEEIHAGLNTGIIRAMGGTGSVVTSAGLVFAFTMMTMAVSQLTVIGQVGTTIGLGLLFDTLIVRSLMTPSIAALLGKWFWWPQVVRQRPKPSPWPAPVERENLVNAYASVNPSAAAQADLQDAAGDDSGVGDQVEHAAADVFGLQPRLRDRVGLHHPAHQVVGDVSGVGAAGGLHHRRLRGGRADDVDRHTLLGHLQGGGLGQADDAPLGGVVGSQVRDAHPATHRRGDDDAAEALLSHHRYGRAQGVERAGQVGVDQLLPHPVADLVEGSGADDAGVGHHDVEAAQVGDGLRDGGVDRGRVAHVQGQRHTAPAQFLDQLRGLAQVILGAQRVGQVCHRARSVGDHDVGSLGGQRQR